MVCWKEARREEGFRVEGSLGDAQQFVHVAGRDLALSSQRFVSFADLQTLDVVTRQIIRYRPALVMITLDIILRMMTSKCLSWMFWPWERYTFCTSESRYIWQASRPWMRRMACGLKRAFGQRLTGFHIVARAYDQAGVGGDVVFRFFAQLIGHDDLRLAFQAHFTGVLGFDLLITIGRCQANTSPALTWSVSSTSAFQPSSSSYSSSTISLCSTLTTRRSG